MQHLVLENGILFISSSILLQNVIFIPCILALAVSGMKLYRAIIKDKKRDKIKQEISRHTIFSSIILILLELSAFIEVYISSNLLSICVKYF